MPTDNLKREMEACSIGGVPVVFYRGRGGEIAYIEGNRLAGGVIEPLADVLAMARKRRGGNLKIDLPRKSGKDKSISIGPLPSNGVIAEP